jgi:hypothetical protein
MVRPTSENASLDLKGKVTCFGARLGIDLKGKVTCFGARLGEDRVQRNGAASERCVLNVRGGRYLQRAVRDAALTCGRGGD